MASKNALVLGGCGRRGQKLTKKLIDEGYRVVIVDNISNGKHPSKWDNELSCWESPFLIFYEEDVVDFLTKYGQNMFFQGINWDLVMHFAKIPFGDCALRELVTNTLLDAHVFNWILSLPNKPNVITPKYTQFSRDAMSLLN